MPAASPGWLCHPRHPTRPSSQGRNELLKRALEVRKAHGANWTYLIFSDADLGLTNDLVLDFESFLLREEPLYGYPLNINHDKSIALEGSCGAQCPSLLPPTQAPRAGPGGADGAVQLWHTQVPTWPEYVALVEQQLDYLNLLAQKL